MELDAVPLAWKLGHQEAAQRTGGREVIRFWKWSRAEWTDGWRIE